MSWMTQLTPWGLLFQFHGQLALKFHWVQMCFGFVLILSYLNCVYRPHQHYIMSTPVSQLTVEQTHKEFNSLPDKIAAKYEHLDSSKFGVVSTPGFNAKSAKLACLFPCMNQLCQRLNLPMPAQLHRLPFFKHWRALFGSKLYSM